MRDVMGIIADEYGKISNPPLVYTLAMLRFPLQSNLGERVSGLQESLKQNYPIFETRTQQGIEVVQSPDRQSFSSTSKPEYLFFDENRSKGVLIAEDRVIFHSSEYPNFDVFSSWFKEVTQVVVDVLSLSHFSGCGIRYIDNIVPKYDEGESLSDYLQDSLLQFDLGDGDIARNISSVFVNVYKSNFGVVNFKSYTLANIDLCVPPELQDTASLLRFKSKVDEAPFATLDFDHVYTVPDGAVVKLDLDELVTMIDGMHRTASQAFLKAVKADAVRRWS